MRKNKNNKQRLDFYIDSVGQVYYVVGRRVENYEGPIKIDDLGSFLQESTRIPNPRSVANFIISKLEKIEVSLYN